MEWSQLQYEVHKLFLEIGMILKNNYSRVSKMVAPIIIWHIVRRKCLNNEIKA